MRKQDNQREDILTAYITGLFDGEGTIAIFPTKESWGTKYQVLMSFVNTNKEAVELVRKFLGAKSIFVHSPGQNGFKGNYPCYKCKLVGTVRVLDPLKKMLPYLLIKRKHVELAIKFCENRNISKPTRTLLGKHRIASREARWRENIYKRYKAIAHPQRLTEKTLEKSEVIV